LSLIRLLSIAKLSFVTVITSTLFSVLLVSVLFLYSDSLKKCVTKVSAILGLEIGNANQPIEQALTVENRLKRPERLNQSRSDFDANRLNRELLPKSSTFF
jgi:uncharacterized protein (DUF3084 family)